MGFLSKIFGDPNQRLIKGLQPAIEKINSFLTEGWDLKSKTDKLGLDCTIPWGGDLNKYRKGSYGQVDLSKYRQRH